MTELEAFFCCVCVRERECLRKRQWLRGQRFPLNLQQLLRNPGVYFWRRQRGPRGPDVTFPGKWAQRAGRRGAKPSQGSEEGRERDNHWKQVRSVNFDRNFLLPLSLPQKGPRLISGGSYTQFIQAGKTQRGCWHDDELKARDRHKSSAAKERHTSTPEGQQSEW